MKDADAAGGRRYEHPDFCFDSNDDARKTRSRLESVCLVVIPAIVLSVVQQDPDDDRVLECAIAGAADFVISGDRHLLQLGSYEGIPILTVRSS